MNIDKFAERRTHLDFLQEILTSSIGVQSHTLVTEVSVWHSSARTTSFEVLALEVG